MFGFQEARAAVEAEGVYIGGWSLKQAVVPEKNAGTMCALKPQQRKS